MAVYIYAIDASPYLMHHGIRGQRWGVRRFQDASGSLTNAGRERYGSAKKLAKFGVALGKAKAEQYGQEASGYAKNLSRNLNRALYAPINRHKVNSYINKRSNVETRLAELEAEHQSKLKQGQYYMDRALAKVGQASMRDSYSRASRDSNMSSRYNRNIEGWQSYYDQVGTHSSWTSAAKNRAEAAKLFAREAGVGENLLPKSIAYQSLDTLSRTSGYSNTARAGREYADALARYEEELNTPSWTRYYD